MSFNSLSPNHRPNFYRKENFQILYIRPTLPKIALLSATRAFLYHRFAYLSQPIFHLVQDLRYSLRPPTPALPHPSVPDRKVRENSSLLYVSRMQYESFVLTEFSTNSIPWELCLVLSILFAGYAFLQATEEAQLVTFPANIIAFNGLSSEMTKTDSRVTFRMIESCLKCLLLGSIMLTSLDDSNKFCTYFLYVRIVMFVLLVSRCQS